MKRSSRVFVLAVMALSASLVFSGCGGADSRSASVDGNKTYKNTSGAALINTKYGAFGPQLNPGVATVVTSNDAVTKFEVAGSPLEDGQLTKYLSWNGVYITLTTASATGLVSATTATVNAKGLTMRVVGSLCAAAIGIEYCNVFTPADPLNIYFSPTPQLDQQSTVVLGGLVNGDGTFSLAATGYASVDSTTKTGWAVGKLINGSGFALNLTGMTAQ